MLSASLFERAICVSAKARYGDDADGFSKCFAHWLAHLLNFMILLGRGVERGNTQKTAIESEILRTSRFAVGRRRKGNMPTTVYLKSV